MKEELQGKLVEILTSIQTAAGKASDFAMAELPDIAQSYILYGRAWITLEAVLWAAVVLASAIGVRWSFKNSNRHEGAAFAAGLGGSITGVLGFVLFVLCLQSAFLVWFAPKVWLLKEIAKLVK